MNTKPLFDEYAVDNSEDELDRDNHSLDEPNDDDVTSEALIKAFSPHNVQALEEEIQYVAQSQCLYLKGFQYDKFHFKNQDDKTVTSGRPNTRFFSSRSPN
ncbi:hypothetical protein EJD97_009234, partial [Solanum chilense]